MKPSRKITAKHISKLVDSAKELVLVYVDAATSKDPLTQQQKQNLNETKTELLNTIAFFEGALKSKKG